MTHSLLNSRPISKEISLRSGVLQIHIDRAEMNLEELCGFASRRSRKRGFVFVSKVLGKHYPVRPKAMTNVFARLGCKLNAVEGPALVIAMAETATGLGQGVYESLWQLSGQSDLLFLHSTRYRLQKPLALQFDESHSHATEHLLYEPAAEHHRRLFQQARTLILIDDEITTGNTLANLALAYRRQYVQLRQVHLVCLTDWLGPARQKEIERRIGLPVRFQSLLQGSFSFQGDSDFDPGPIPHVVGDGQYKDQFLPVDSGRAGQVGLLNLPAQVLEDLKHIPRGERILVLGTGEFAYPPYRLARWLEQLGHDVHYQSTTRSPLLVEKDLASVLEFVDNYHDGIPNFVYNVADKKYDRIVICYETTPLPQEHRLAELLGGQTVFF